VSAKCALLSLGLRQVAPRLIAVRGYLNLILHEDTTQSDLDTMRTEASCSQMESSFAAFGVCPFVSRAHASTQGIPHVVS